MFLSTSFRRARVSAATTALALGLSLGACGDSSGPSEPALNQATSMELLGYLFSIAFSFGMGADAAGLIDGLPPALSADTYSFDETTSCPRGGNIRLEGTITDNTNAQGTGSVALQFKQTPAGCRVETQENGVFEMNGNPSIGLAMSSNFVNHEPSGEMTFQYTGGFRWAGQGQSGSCDMNVTYRFNYQTQTVRVNGTMCGHNMNFNG
jgi:hypothetical protein